MPAGWRLAGVAEFGRGSAAARLHYRVEVDTAWRTRLAAVEGVIGTRPLVLHVERSAAGEWRIDEAPAPELDGLVDVDFGFTPATNLFPLRRLALTPGQGAEVEAAWLDATTWTFRRLPQRYVRRGADRYWYEAPTLGYAGLLTVAPSGFVRDYPGLWIAADEGLDPVSSDLKPPPQGPV